MLVYLCVDQCPTIYYYRFFFKSYCEDLQMEIIEEFLDDDAVLPMIQGKIIGRVEKVSAT